MTVQRCDLHPHRFQFKNFLLASTTALWTWSGAMAQSAEHRFDIPAQDTASALREFGRQSSTELLFPYDVAAGHRSPTIKGKLSDREVLSRLATSAGLIVLSNDGKTATLGAKPGGSPESPTRLGDASHASPSEGGSGVQEIVVTAQKREERLKDVPVPVSVLNANNLADNGIVNLRDYAITVPGFSVQPYYSGTQTIGIRGITTGGFSIPTVGVTIDGVPYGNQTAYVTNIVPDIDPGELARIEVLRGPQGTLYGANSLGGLVNYVTVDPSTDGFSGRVEAGMSFVQNGAEPGFNIRGSANIPIYESLAIRVSGFKRQDPGYIDNPVLGLKGVNEVEADGARMSALWTPSDNFSLKINAMYEFNRRDGVNEIDELPGLGDLQQNYIPGVGQSENVVQSYSAVLNYRLASIDLTSITGYNTIRVRDTLDDTPNVGGLTARVAGGITGSPYHDSAVSRALSEELRASVPIGDRFELLAGAFYRGSITRGTSTFYASDPPSPKLLTTTFDYTLPHNLDQEYAAFADLTYHITDRLDVQIGGRETHISETKNPEYATGPFIPFFYGQPSPFVSPETKASSNTFTYLFTPRFKITPDVMVYARLASGFRPGGANQGAAAAYLPQYKPDKTQNYEIGVKGDFLDHVLTVDASLYYVDWNNVQFVLRTPNQFPYNGNAGGAKSEGVELSIVAKPTSDLTITGWIDYDDAVLTQTVNNAGDYLVAGERLPDTSRWSGHISVNQEFPLWNSVTGFVGGEASFVGNRVGLFQPTALRQYYPSYVRTDLRAGVRRESWTATFYVNNIADVRKFIAGGIGYVYPFAFVPLQPRTLGFSIAKAF